MFPFLAAFQKFGLELGEQGGVLFSHGLPKHVGFALGETGQFLGQTHDLLLVNRNSVRLFQKFLHVGQVVGNRFGSVFPADERRDVFQRTGTVQGVHGNQILKYRRLQVPQVFLHSRRFVLENTDRIPALEEGVGSGVVDGNCFQIDGNTVAHTDQFQGVF